MRIGARRPWRYPAARMARPGPCLSSQSASDSLHLPAFALQPLLVDYRCAPGLALPTPGLGLI